MNTKEERIQTQEEIDALWADAFDPAQERAAKRMRRVVASALLCVLVSGIFVGAFKIGFFAGVRARLIQLQDRESKSEETVFAQSTPLAEKRIETAMVTFARSLRTGEGTYAAESAADLIYIVEEMRARGEETADVHANFEFNKETLSEKLHTIVEGYSWSSVGSDVKLTLKYTIGEAITRQLQAGEACSFNAEQTEVYEKARRILTDILVDGMSDYEKEIAIADYLADSVTYAIRSDLRTEDAYGALMHGYAQCSGYTDAFALLARMAGLRVWSVSGEAISTEGAREAHAWNLIDLGGKWYVIDVTWSDADETPDVHPRGLINVPPEKLTSHKVESLLPEGEYARDFDEYYPYVRSGRMIGSTEALVAAMLEDIPDRGELLAFVSEGVNIADAWKQFYASVGANTSMQMHETTYSIFDDGRVMRFAAAFA